MGISGLLPFLKKIHKPVNIAEFAGCTVAIDAYCWLHKGAFSCADKLAVGEKTDQYVYYCMKYIEYMLRNHIKPIMVFDGCHLPSKKEVEKQRREKREIFRKKAAQFLREGKRNEAKECLQRCVDITSQMALELMKVCRERGVDCIVAPYEADAQLAYLNKVGIAQIIVTEDSDLLLFGCEKIIFKMDFFGNGVLIEQSNLNEVLDMKNGFYTFDKFRYLCILSGCDYLASLPGIGLAKAAKVFKTARQPDLRQLLKKLPTYIKMNVVVPDEYIENFIKADNTFLYQLAYDPQKRKLVPLNAYSPDVDSKQLDYAGPYLSDDKAYQIALGNMDIYSGEKIYNFDPDNFVPSKASYLKKVDHLHMLSIWNRSYRPRPKLTLKEIQTPDRPNLKGKEVIVESKFLKRSPVKRPREVDDCKAVKSDGEFMNMYSDILPEAKKLKTNENTSDNEGQLEESTLMNKDDVPEIPSPLKKSADNSPIHQHETKGKENNVLSPRKNRFAVGGSSKKSRFSLSVGKVVEVRSRFFAKNSKSDLLNSLHNQDKIVEKETNQVSEGEEIKSDLGIESVKSPQKDSETKETAMTEDDSDNVCSVDDSDRHLETTCSSVEKKFSPTASPHFSSSLKNSPSAFSWSKFKFLKQSRSDAVNDKKDTPFKSLKSSLLRHVKSESGLDVRQSESVGRDTDTSGDEATSGQSNHLFNRQIISSVKTDLASSPVSQTREHDVTDEKDVVDLTDDRLEPEKDLASSQNSYSSQKSSSSLTNSQKVKCRISGLSKRKSSPADNKQRSITDLFSKFAHTKSISKIKPVTEDDDDNDIFRTPNSSQSQTLMKKEGNIQRKLIE